MSRLTRSVFTTTVFVLALSWTGSARAQGVFSSSPDGKAGRFMFNLKVGPAFGVYDNLYPATAAPPAGTLCGTYPYPDCSTPGIGVQGTIMFDFGFAVTPNRNGYVLFPLQFQVAGAGSFVMIPVGFQYDIPLPVRGLYLTPRFSTGYSAYVVHNHRAADLGFFLPEFGAKYVFVKRWNVGLDAFSLPIFFGDFTAVSYRVLLYGGVNF